MLIKILENVAMTIALSVYLMSINDQLVISFKNSNSKKDFRFQFVHPILKLKVK